MLVEIVGIGEIPRWLLESLRHELEKTFGQVVKSSIGDTLEIRSAGYNQRREQYDANLILKNCLQTIPLEKLILGVVDVDLYVPGMNFIFGLAQYLGRAALISIKRLDPTFYNLQPNHRLLQERATKEAIHELGHVLGINHCTGPKCVMSFSNNIREVDNKTHIFCEKCAKKLPTK